ncbi:MAG: YdeI/OmpD-associated family protein [Acidobacteria bacterium]|nr:YdeI/OmpD-associated family protein [Acidobacteriota bacterium]
MTTAAQKMESAGPLTFLHFKNRFEWRSWLEGNHNKAKKAWLTHYKKATGRPSVNYNEAVEEALCFGWVDGKKKSVNSERYAYRYTPRAPKSTWSALNIKRAKKLIAEGRMTKAGLRAFEGHEKRRTIPVPTRLSGKSQGLFEANQEAWNHFERFSPGYKRLCIGWVASAKQDATQHRRLNKLIEHSARNVKIKFM